ARLPLRVNRLRDHASAGYSLNASLPSIVPMAFQAARLMELAMKRVVPSPKETWTPPVCRLRAVLTRDVEAPLVQGIKGSLLAMMPHRALSGTVLLGPLMVMKMLGQWLGEA